MNIPPPTKSKPNGHPADGMTMRVPMGQGVDHVIVDPRSLKDERPCAEWTLRYGNAESIKLTVATLVADYDYLLSRHLTMKEATRRLRIMRQYRAAALAE